VTALDDVQGIQRVAAFLLSLDSQKASEVLGSMHPDIVSRVAEAMLDLDPRLTETGVIDELVQEVASKVGKPRGVRTVDEPGMREMLVSALGASANGVFDDVLKRRRGDNPFTDLESYATRTVATVLQMESPAVCALALAHVDASFAADVLRFFEEDDQLDVMRRMARLTPPGAPVLKTIATNLVDQIENVPPVSEKADPSARLKSIAEILNNSSPEVEKRVMEVFGDMDPEMAQEVREYMFTWEDVSTINKRAMQKILGMVDTKTLSIALKGASVAVEENILGNLSSRVREMVSEEREIAGPMPLSDVQDARNEIMVSIRALIEAGEFRPTRGSDALVE